MSLTIKPTSYHLHNLPLSYPKSRFNPIPISLLLWVSKYLFCPPPSPFVLLSHLTTLPSSFTSPLSNAYKLMPILTSPVLDPHPSEHSLMLTTFYMLLCNSSPHCHRRNVGSNFCTNLKIGGIAIFKGFLHHSIILLLGSLRISCFSPSLLPLEIFH